MKSSPSKTRYCVMLVLSKFVRDNLIYGNIMLYMSLGLVVLLLLWIGNCTGYPRQSHLVLFPWSLPRNARRSSLRPRSLSSSWFSLRVSEKSQPHLGPPWTTSPHNKIKWIRSWKNTQISSPHLSRYLCTVRSRIPLIWLPTHRYPMGQSIAAIF